MILWARVVAKTSGCKGGYSGQRFLSGARIGLVANEATSYPVCSFQNISKCAICMVGRGTSAPNLPERVCLGPQGSLRVARRSKVEGLFESVFFRVFLILLGVMLFTVPPNRGLGQSPKLIRSSFQLGRHFSKFLAPDHDKLELLNTDSAGL